MTDEDLITAPENTTIEEAKEILKNIKIEKTTSCRWKFLFKRTNNNKGI